MFAKEAGAARTRSAPEVPRLTVQREGAASFGIPLQGEAVGQSGWLEGEENRGDARKARDSDLLTAWIFLPTSEPGWLDLQMPVESTLLAVGLNGGQVGPGKDFQRCARPRTVEVWADGRLRGLAVLEDTPEVQYLVFSPPLLAGKLRLRILDTHPGRESPEVALAEVELYGKGRPRAAWDLNQSLVYHQEVGLRGASSWYWGLVDSSGHHGLLARGSLARKSPRDPALLIWEVKGTERMGRTLNQSGDLWLVDAQTRLRRKVASFTAEEMNFQWSREGEMFRVEALSPRQSTATRTFFDASGTEVATLTLPLVPGAERDFAERHAPLDQRFCPSGWIPPVAYPAGQAPAQAGCTVGDAGARRDHPELWDVAGDGDMFRLNRGTDTFRISLNQGVMRVEKEGHVVDETSGVLRVWAFPGDLDSLYVARQKGGGVRILARPFPAKGEEKGVAGVAGGETPFQFAASSEGGVVTEGKRCSAEGSLRVLGSTEARWLSFAGGVDVEDSDSQDEGDPFIGEVRLMGGQVWFSAWSREEAGVWRMDPSAPGGAVRVVRGGTFASPDLACGEVGK